MDLSRSRELVGVGAELQVEDKPPSMVQVDRSSKHRNLTPERLLFMCLVSLITAKFKLPCLQPQFRVCMVGTDCGICSLLPILPRLPDLRQRVKLIH